MRTDVMKRVERYRSLMAPGSIDDGRPEGALERLLSLVELSFDLCRTEGLERALHLAGELRRRGLTPGEPARLHYCEAVAWEKLRLLGTGEEDLWQSERPEIEKELLHLRRALDRKALAAMPRELVARILTNMATLYHHAGRFSEAVEHWDRALRVESSSPWHGASGPMPLPITQAPCMTPGTKSFSSGAPGRTSARRFTPISTGRRGSSSISGSGGWRPGYLAAPRRASLSSSDARKSAPKRNSATGDGALSTGCFSIR